MSNLTTRPDSNQVVLKPGVYQSGNTKGGLNLKKWLFRVLAKAGFAGTNDPLCCQYFPTATEVLVGDAQNVTEAEMINVPDGGFFKAMQTDGTWYIYIKIDATTVSSALANN